MGKKKQLKKLCKLMEAQCLAGAASAGEAGSGAASKPGAGMPMGATPANGIAGFLGGMSQTQQFLLGLAVGGGLTYILSDEEIRGRIMKAGMKLYTDIAGGVEEMKEQMADLKAEMEAGSFEG